MSLVAALALMSATSAPPAWFTGTWEPYSNAFIGLRLLTVKGNTLSWHGCTNAPYEVLDVDGKTLTIRLAKDTRCTLNDEPATRIDTVRFALRENGCDLKVSMYGSPEAMKRDELAAEGLYGKLKCPSGPVPQAAANVSRTPR